ncbi:MAG: hypothetical protein GY770_16915 [Aestuariibacter sp.]|nr:hypothetical protein [Aestuariibacter sp.]
MSKTNANIRIDCKSCQYLSDANDSGFEISVPVNDDVTGFSGSAILHCVVNNDNHIIRLRELIADSSSIPPSATLLRRLNATLNVLAEKRLCGNHHICPSEVLQVINETVVC